MSAGEAIDRAHRNAARAVGILVFMIVKRRISRENLEAALTLLDESSNAIRGVLTASGGGDRVGVPTPESSGEDNGTTDKGR